MATTENSNIATANDTTATTANATTATATTNNTNETIKTKPTRINLKKEDKLKDDRFIVNPETGFPVLKTGEIGQAILTGKPIPKKRQPLNLVMETMQKSFSNITDDDIKRIFLQVFKDNGGIPKSVPEKWGGKAKKTAVKDKPLSAYAIFVRNNLPKVKADEGEDVFSILHVAWNALSKEEKDKYFQIEKEELNEYNKKNEKVTQQNTDANTNTNTNQSQILASEQSLVGEIKEDDDEDDEDDESTDDNTSKEEEKVSIKEEIKEAIKEEIKEAIKEEVKEEIKEAIKEAVEEEIKEEEKEKVEEE